jgi:hypothetical protein
MVTSQEDVTDAELSTGVVPVLLPIQNPVSG